MPNLSQKQKENFFMAGYLEEERRVAAFLNEMKAQLGTAKEKLNYAGVAGVKGVIAKLHAEIAEIDGIIARAATTLPNATDSGRAPAIVFTAVNAAEPFTVSRKSSASADSSAASASISASTEKELKAAGRKYARTLMGIDDKATLAYAMSGKSTVGVATDSLAEKIHQQSVAVQKTLKDASKTTVVKAAGLSGYFNKAADKIKSSAQSFWQNHKKKIIAGAVVGLTLLAVGCCFFPPAISAVPFLAKANVSLVAAYHAVATQAAPAALAYVKTNIALDVVVSASAGLAAVGVGFYKKATNKVETDKADRQFNPSGRE